MEEDESDDGVDKDDEKVLVDLPAGFEPGQTVYFSLAHDEDVAFGERGEVLGGSTDPDSPVLVRFASGEECACNPDCISLSQLFPVEIEIIDVAIAVSAALGDPAPPLPPAPRPPGSTLNASAAPLQQTQWPELPVVTSVLCEETLRLEMGTPTKSARESGDIDAFWPPECTLSDAKQRDLFWQCRRSGELIRDGGMRAVAAVSIVLEDLHVKQGVRLTYQGRPVENVLVMNSTMVNASALLKSAPTLVDQVSGISASLLPTYAAKREYSKLEKDVRARLGLATWNEQVSGAALDGATEAQSSWTAPADSGLGMQENMSHRWVSCVLAGRSNPEMVHMDICGPALLNFDYHETPFSKDVGLPRSAPLHAFLTPLYFYFPSPCPEGSLKHKFLCLPLDFAGGGVVAVPKDTPSHLSCLERMAEGIEEGTSFNEFLEQRSKQALPAEVPEGTLEAMATETFLGRLPRGFLDAELKQRMVSVRDRLVAHAVVTSSLAIGSIVEVLGLQSKPELNGRKGRIVAAKGQSGIDRVPVLVAGVADPIRLRGSCVRFLPSVAAEDCMPQVLGLQQMLEGEGSVKAHLLRPKLKDSADELSGGSEPGVALNNAMKAVMGNKGGRQLDQLKENLNGKNPMAAIQAMMDGKGGDHLKDIVGGKDPMAAIQAMMDGKGGHQLKEMMGGQEPMAAIQAMMSGKGGNQLKEMMGGQDPMAAIQAMISGKKVIT